MRHCNESLFLCSLIILSTLIRATTSATAAEIANQAVIEQSALAVSGFPSTLITGITRPTLQAQIPLGKLTSVVDSQWLASQWQVTFAGVVTGDSARQVQVVMDSSGQNFLTAYWVSGRFSGQEDSAAGRNPLAGLMGSVRVAYSIPTDPPATTLAQALVASEMDLLASQADRVEAYYLRCVWQDSERYGWLPSDTTLLWVVCKWKYAPPAVNRHGTQLGWRWDYDCTIVLAATGQRVFGASTVPW